MDESHKRPLAWGSPFRRQGFYTFRPTNTRKENVDTITFQHEGQTYEVPLVVAFGPDGKPAELIGDIEL